MGIKENLERIRKHGFPLLAAELEEVVETRSMKDIEAFVDVGTSIMEICYDLSQICNFGGNK